MRLSPTTNKKGIKGYSFSVKTYKSLQMYVLGGSVSSKIYNEYES